MLKIVSNRTQIHILSNDSPFNEVD